MNATFDGTGAGYELLDPDWLPDRLVPLVPGLYAFHLQLDFDKTGGGAFGAGAGYVQVLMGTVSTEPPRLTGGRLSGGCAGGSTRRQPAIRLRSKW